jgi:hypothetical protein
MSASVTPTSSAADRPTLAEKAVTSTAALPASTSQKAQKPKRHFGGRGGKGKGNGPKQGQQIAADVRKGAPISAKALAAMLQPREFGVDSMASVHLSGTKEVFIKDSLRKCKPFNLEVADSGIVQVSEVGSVELHVDMQKPGAKPGELPTVTFVIRDVYYSPRFGANLLSVGRLRDDKWEFHSTKEETYLITPDNLKVNLRTENRVSVLRCRLSAAGHGAAKGKAYAVGNCMEWDGAASLVHLHERLGHMGFDRMLRIIKADKTEGLGRLSMSPGALQEARKRVMECRACIRGKGTRTAFGRRGLHKGHAPGEVLNMDTFYVKYFRADLSKCIEYGLVVSCAHSTFKWTQRLATKDEGAQAVVNIITAAQTQFDCSVKRLQVDGGGEFINAKVKLLCSKSGIHLHQPPAGTPQLNSIAERNVRTGKDAGRTLLMHCGLPARFGPRAVEHSNYIWNRTNVADATGVTPYEAMLKRKPSVEHVGVFGCDAYYHIPKSDRGVFDAKMLPGIYVGHSELRNCAVIYDLRSGKEIFTRDVEFLDRRFTHAAALSAGGDQLRELLDNASFVRDGPPSIVMEHESVAAGFADEPLDREHLDNPTDGTYQVERIIGKRVRDGVLQYQVQWVDYQRPTWEPASNVEEGASEAISDFEAMAISREVNSEVAPAATSDAEEKQSEDQAPLQSPQLPASGGALQAASPAPRSPIMAAQSPAAAPVAEASPPSAPAAVGADAAHSLRRSQRNHASSASADAASTSGHQARLQVAMSAVCSSMPGGDDRLNAEDTQMAFAVADGLALLEEQTPQTWKEAMSSPDAAKWKEAADKEMAGCELMKVWELVPRSSVAKEQTVIPCKWVFKVKTDSSGAVEKYKARITPKGFRQKEGINFHETFAPTGKYKSLRLCLSIAAACDHELDQMDVPQAFLNADVDEEVYMDVPEGYRAGREHLVCRLKKALYGLKQAPRNWYLLCTQFLVEELKFHATVSDPNLYWRRSRSGRLMKMWVFVDDFQAQYDHDHDKAEFLELLKKLEERFGIKYLGPSTWILGMRITRDRKARTIKLDQELYITKALERFGMQQCKPVATPCVHGALEATTPIDVEDAGNANSAPDLLLYQEMVGTLMYAAVACRPDIAYAVQLLARGMQAPTQQHMVAAKRVFRYLAGTKTVGLVFGSRNGDQTASTRGRDAFRLDVCAFADADWANDKADRKSITGWVAKVNGDPISWASKKQRTVAQSSCEAELYAEAAAIQEVLWLQGLLKELGLHVQTGSVVHGDNQSTLAISANGIKGERTKHVDVKYHFITETVNEGKVRLKWIPTTDQQADIFTKALPFPPFLHFRRQIMSC